MLQSKQDHYNLTRHLLQGGGVANNTRLQQGPGTLHIYPLNSNRVLKSPLKWGQGLNLLER